MQNSKEATSVRKARDLIGLPVLAVDSGKLVGHAKDLLIDEGWQIKGVVLEAKHWFNSSRYIEGSDIIACGEDAITIPNEKAIRSLDDQDHLLFFMNGIHKVKGLPVITIGGQQLGILEDVYLKKDWGKQIVGYEISEGFISDVKNGRKWLPMPEQAVKGEDAIIVPVHSIYDIEEPFVSNEE
jgi:uncharacterized protein YrrD